MSRSRPTSPAALAEWRAQFLDDQYFWQQIMPTLAAVHQDLGDPYALHDSIRNATLWWVGTDCCELLSQSAPSMPPVTLTPDLVPDSDGFAFLEKPITGKDAWNPDKTFTFDCIHWQPLLLKAHVACVAIIMWTTEQPHDPDPNLTAPTPLGRSDWPYGFDTDVHLPDVRPQAQASILEDRQLLAALWQLTSQPELVEANDVRPNRATSRRISRRGYEPSPIRVINLNRKKQRRRAKSTHAGREYTCQWVVQAHWRQQPYGPGRSLRRARWIDTHIKGPEDKPLHVRDTVKVWTKPTPGTGHGSQEVTE